MKPSAFLELLWGERPPGLVQLWHLASRRSRYLSEPAMVDGLVEGRADIYTAVSTVESDLGPTRRGSAAQAHAIAGLWLDLDLAIEGKQGAPSIDAALELSRRIAQPTVVVSSGHGLHAWWLFEGPWVLDADRERAGEMSLAWHHLHAKLAEFPIDSAQDLARLLRLPGTVNAKRDPVGVEVLEHEGNRYPVEELAAICAKAPRAKLAPPAPVATVDPAEFRALQQSARFAGLWSGLVEPGWSMSERDLALASIAAGRGWSADAIRGLIVHHRETRDPGGRKQLRGDYLDRTVTKAMQTTERPATPKPARGSSFTAEQWREVILTGLQAEDDATVRFPFPALTHALDGGLRPGQVCLLAGYTAHGKSVLLDQIADAAAADGRKVHLYLTEMTAAARGLRLLARRTGVAFRSLRRGELSDGEWRSVLEELEKIDYGLSIVNDWSVDEVVDHVRENEWDLAVVDLIHGFHYADERELSKTSSAIVRAAKGWTPGTAVLAAAHLNDGQMRDSRSARRPKPGLHSIKGSSSLKQDADVVVFVWREDDEQGLPGLDGAVWIAKNRDGDLGGCDVVLNPARMRFEEPIGLVTVAR